MFQPVVRVNSEKIYEINLINNTSPKDSVPPCYSRFVPEQTDDYAWENNRVAFRTYADWDAAGNKISEVKKISSDYGSNLSRFEISIKGNDTKSAGITLQEKNGEGSINQENRWLSYWEPHQDSELDTGIVIPLLR